MTSPWYFWCVQEQLVPAEAARTGLQCTRASIAGGGGGTVLRPVGGASSLLYKGPGDL